MSLRYGAPRSVRPLLHPSRMGMMRTRLRRFQTAAFLAAFVLFAVGAYLSGGFSADTLTPAQTLQTAVLPVAPRAAAPTAPAPEVAPVKATAPAPAPRPEKAAPAPEAPAPESESDDDRAATSGDFFAEGTASYYGRELAGRPTASGERFDPNGLTAAHRTLPLGSRIRVTNPRNGQSVVVRVNDRGPFHGNRILDLSHGAARAIGMATRGTGHVVIDLIERGRGRKGRRAAEPAAEVAPAPDTVDAPASPAPKPAPTDSTED